jgi:hypothetical protein
LIRYFISWIEQNYTIEPVVGVRGSNTIRDIKTWSTAQAIIGLSRVLQIRQVSVPDTKLPNYNIEADNAITEIAEIVREDKFQETPKWLIAIYIFLGCFAFYFVRDFIKDNWNTYEPLIWLISFIICVIVILIGVKTERLKRILQESITMVVYGPKIIRKIQIIITKLGKNR